MVSWKRQVSFQTSAAITILTLFEVAEPVGLPTNVVPAGTEGSFDVGVRVSVIPRVDGTPVLCRFEFRGSCTSPTSAQGADVKGFAEVMDW